MSNNKQSMKLYTEEHLKIFYNLGKVDGFIGRQDDVNVLIKNYPTIELPSDEEIQDESVKYYDNNAAKAHDYYFELGAKWMREKIQGGNK